MGTIAVPASYFGIVLGLAGLGGAWRHAAHVWGLPGVVGEILMLVAAVTWLLLLALYAAKWLHARADALQELGHPVQCCFVGLIGVATMLVATAALPYSRVAAVILFILGAAFTIAFAVWLSYNDPYWIAERHRLGAAADPRAQAMATALAALARDATGG